MTTFWIAVASSMIGALLGFAACAILTVGSDADDQMDYVTGFKKGKEAGLREATKGSGDPN